MHRQEADAYSLVASWLLSYMREGRLFVPPLTASVSALQRWPDKIRYLVRILLIHAIITFLLSIKQVSVALLTNCSASNVVMRLGHRPIRVVQLWNRP